MGLWALAATRHIGQAKHWNAPHAECWIWVLCLTGQGVMTTEGTKGIYTKFLEIPSWDGNLSTLLSAKDVWDLQMSCLSWKFSFIWYAFNSLSAFQVLFTAMAFYITTKYSICLGSCRPGSQVFTCWGGLKQCLPPAMEKGETRPGRVYKQTQTWIWVKGIQDSVSAP